MPTTVWERLRTGGKTSFDKTWQALDKLGAPVNRLSNKIGSEAFWPTTLDKESDKAARILRSFCKDGFYGEEEVQTAEGPKLKQRVLQKIPEKVIKNAKGLAIFTTMRTGLWMSGSGGSGILVARLPDGSWSPPSGILMHTAGLGFMVGIDIYDCVVVINNEKTLEGFTKIRCTLGAEMSVTAGPLGAGGVLDTELHKRQAPIYTYLKSRGFYAGVQIDGTIVIERVDENERFYGEKLPVKDILAGKVRHPPYELKMLMETLKAAEGDKTHDPSLVPLDAPPGDFEIDTGTTFGVPGKDDPDPYGVLALEKEGMSLKEAGTSKRASWEQFSFNPSPTSPVHSVYARQSTDHSRSMSRQSNWRASGWGNEPKTPSSLRTSFDRAPVQMSDSSTQTDFPVDTPASPLPRSTRSSILSNRSSKASLSTGYQVSMQDVPEDSVLESPDRKEPANVSNENGYTTPPSTPPALPVVAPLPIAEHEELDETNDKVGETNNKVEVKEEIDDAGQRHDHEALSGNASEEHLEDDHDDIHEDDHVVVEEPIVQSFQHAKPASAQVISKARLVTVPKRVPPKLPPRNPSRNNGPLAVDAASLNASSSSVSLASSSASAQQEVASPLNDDIVSTETLPATSPLSEKLTTITLEDHTIDDESARGLKSTAPLSLKIPGGFE